MNDINFVCVPAKHHNNMYIEYGYRVRKFVGGSTDVDDIADTATKQTFNLLLLCFMDNPLFLMVYLYI